MLMTLEAKSKTASTLTENKENEKDEFYLKDIE